MFVERAADPLHDAAADLLVDKLRVDDCAAILDAPVFEKLHFAGRHIDFQIRALHAVGEGERPAARHIMTRDHELGLKAGRQRVGAEIDDARDLLERQALAAAAGVDDDAAANVERCRVGLQHRAGRGQHVGAQRLAGLPGRFAADAGGARGPGAAAIGRVVGIAGDDAHALDRHAERGGDTLRQHRFGALALFGNAGMHEHGAGRIEA